MEQASAAPDAVSCSTVVGACDKALFITSSAIPIFASYFESRGWQVGLGAHFLSLALRRRRNDPKMKAKKRIRGDPQAVLCVLAACSRAALWERVHVWRMEKRTSRKAVPKGRCIHYVHVNVLHIVCYIF